MASTRVRVALSCVLSMPNRIGKGLEGILPHRLQTRAHFASSPHWPYSNDRASSAEPVLSVLRTDPFHLRTGRSNRPVLTNRKRPKPRSVLRFNFKAAGILVIPLKGIFMMIINRLTTWLRENELIINLKKRQDGNDAFRNCERLNRIQGRQLNLMVNGLPINSTTSTLNFETHFN